MYFLYQEEYIYCYTYMALVVSIMQEDTPRRQVTTPMVIEAEIQQGYELLTGFENILSSKSPDEFSNFMQGTNHKNHPHSNALQDPCDSGSSSCNGLHLVDSHVPDSQIVNGKQKGPRLKHVSHSYSSGHLRENGYLVENDPKSMHMDKKVVAPAAPGHVWNPPTYPVHNGNDSHAQSVYYGETTKRKPLFRQNAEEMVDLSPGYGCGSRSGIDLVNSSFL